MHISLEKLFGDVQNHIHIHSSIHKVYVSFGLITEFISNVWYGTGTFSILLFSNFLQPYVYLRFISFMKTLSWDLMTYFVSGWYMYMYIHCHNTLYTLHRPKLHKINNTFYQGICFSYCSPDISWFMHSNYILSYCKRLFINMLKG